MFISSEPDWLMQHRQGGVGRRFLCTQLVRGLTSAPTSRLKQTSKGAFLKWTNSEFCPRNHCSQEQTTPSFARLAAQVLQHLAPKKPLTLNNWAHPFIPEREEKTNTATYRPRTKKRVTMSCGRKKKLKNGAVMPISNCHRHVLATGGKGQQKALKNAAIINYAVTMVYLEFKKAGETEEVSSLWT